MIEKEKGVQSKGRRVPAGWLIEKVGMKGMCVGEAQASVQHPNYIVNTGGASAKEVSSLAEKIEKEVHEIKEHMINGDKILSKDDLESLREAEKDLGEGKTKRIL